MRGMWSTVALVLVLAGLGAYIYFVDSEKPAPGMEPKEKVFAVESGKINEVRITAGGETTALVKKDTGWTVEIEMTIADDGETVDLNFFPEFIRLCGLESQSPSGEVVQPVFETSKIATQIVTKFGQQKTFITKESNDV